MAFVRRDLRWPRAWMALWLVAILAVIVLSLVPPPPMPMEPPKDFDKFLHFAAYFALAFSAVQVFERRVHLIGIAVGLIALGFALEWAQGALAPKVRMADGWDGLADTLGVVVGMALYLTPWRNLLLRLEQMRP